MIITLITALYLMQAVSAKSAYTFLYISGVLLIAGEIAFTTYGLVGAQGALALFVGYIIHTGAATMFGIPFDWGLVFGLAFVEFLAGIIAVTIALRYRKIRSTTGKETLPGQKAKVLKWSGNSGTVLIEGENWRAMSETPLELQPDQEVTVLDVEGLTLKITVN
jgi:membrane-bound serine protease (ClpP class)